MHAFELPEDKLAEEATAWFVRVHSDTADEIDRRDLQNWLDQDPSHRTAYAEAEALWNELGGVPDTRAGSTPKQHSVRTLQTEAVAMSPKRHWARRTGALAACLALGACVGVWALGGYERFQADHFTAVGESKLVEVEDGSTIRLNTESAISLDFTGQVRQVELLRGEAYFDVAPDQERPFVVLAGGSVTRVVGTEFNLREGAQGVRLAVLEGTVEFASEGDLKSTKNGLTLQAGQTASFEKTAGVVSGSADAGAIASWRSGKLVFADRTLKTVVEELDRYRPGAIVFLDSGLADQRFTGVIDFSDTDRALNAIENTLPVDVIRVTGFLTLLRAR